jgi:hypothetical protein
VILLDADVKITQIFAWNYIKQINNVELGLPLKLNNFFQDSAFSFEDEKLINKLLEEVTVEVCTLFYMSLI